MKVYTNYPLDGNENSETVEVDLLSYDRNKYCNVIFNGEIQSMKSGYLYRDPKMKKHVGNWLQKVPFEIGMKMPTNHQYENERRKNRLDKASYLVYNTASSAPYHKDNDNLFEFKNLKDALKKAKTMTFFSVTKETHQKFSWQGVEILSRDASVSIWITSKRMRHVIKTHHVKTYGFLG